MADQESTGATMLPAQRRDWIRAEIERAGGARITQLADQLGVSEMTVRRDLEELASRGLIKKVYGGATAPARSTSDEPGFEVKSHRELAAKDQIGAVAATLIQPRTTVAVSAGTTTYAAALHLARIPGLTVVTNSVRVADYLHAHGDRSQTVLLTGGVRTPSDALVGPVADQAIRSLNFDLAFVGCHGISISAGLSTPNLAEAETNRALIAAARRVVAVADHSKWGLAGLATFAPLSAVDTWVTDGGLPEVARAEATEHIRHLLIA